MKREERLKTPRQFNLVYNQGITQADRLLVLKVKSNSLEFSRFGISISKHVGKAVVRNRVKRVLREIMRQTPKKPGWDIIIIARNPAARSNYEKLNKSVINLLSGAHVAVEQNEILSSGND